MGFIHQGLGKNKINIGVLKQCSPIKNARAEAIELKTERV
jgi:hypothetical protein